MLTLNNFSRIYIMAKSNKKKSQKIRKQPLYQMKGCASRKNRNIGCKKCKKMHVYGTCAYNGLCTCPCECHRKRGQKGGCGCGSTILQTGGASANNYPMTGPFVGNGWTPKISGWPSIDGISGNRNYLEYNNRLVDPQTQIMPYNFRNGWAGGKSRRRKVGGWTYSSSSSTSSSEEDKKPAVVGKGVNGKKHLKKGKKNKTAKRGGGVLANITSDVMFNLKSAYSALNGQAQPVNPSPYMDQMTQKLTLM